MTNYPNPGTPGTPGQTPGYTEPPAYPPTVDRPIQTDLSQTGLSQTGQSHTGQSQTGQSHTGQAHTDQPGSIKGEAKNVAGTTREAGANVAQTAKDEAAGVAAEAKEQAASLFGTVRSEVGQQAGTQQQRIAEALHGLSNELGSMASSSNESGPLTELAKEGSRRGGEIAHWLSQREPSDLLDEVRSYARRRPMTFLAICGAAGLLAGRLTRGMVATNTSLDSPSGGSSGGSHHSDTSRVATSSLTAPAAVDPFARAHAEPLTAAPPVHPRTTMPPGTGPSTPSRGVNPSGW